MSDLSAVCFDLDSTLCVREQSDEEIHEAVFERVGMEPFFTPADVAAVDPTDLPTADSDVEFWEHVFRAVTEEVGGDPAHAPALAEAIVEVVDPTAVAFREGAPEALAYASERYEVGLVTNGGEESQRVKLDVLGIEDAFDATVFCDPASGIEPKPDPAPFERALSDLDGSPGQTLHVGDSHDSDVRGAHGAGLQSAWVPLDTTVESPEPAATYRLDSLADLSRVL